MILVILFMTIGDRANRIVVCIDADEGFDELVRDGVVVALEDAGVGVAMLPCFGVAGDHGAEGFVFLLPAVVAVHGEVASGDAGQLADSVLFEFLKELFDVAGAAGGEGVAAVEEGVDVDALDVLLRGEAEESVEVALLGVDASVGYEAYEVEGLVAVGYVDCL